MNYARLGKMDARDVIHAATILVPPGSCDDNVTRLLVIKFYLAWRKTVRTPLERPGMRTVVLFEIGS